MLAPQLAIYYEATGRLVVSSYGSLGFHFLSPQLWGVLFSVQKGLFFWSPLLLAAVAGFVCWRDREQAARSFAGTAVVLVVDTYLIASWWDWQFGASYGHRGFVDVLPLLALRPRGVLRVERRRRDAAHGGRPCVTTALVALSVFQMLQYWNGVLPMSDMTWEQYRAIFLRFQ